MQIECPICLQVLEDTHTAPSCQHRFCKACIQESLRKCSNSCPQCRSNIPTKRSLRADYAFHALVQSLTPIVEEMDLDSSEQQNLEKNLKDMYQDLKNIKWNFLCSCCEEPLKTCLVSSECNHRFCQECFRKNCTDEQQTSECPSCSHSVKTSFVRDKQYDELASSIEQLITCMEIELKVSDKLQLKSVEKASASLYKENHKKEVIHKVSSIDAKPIQSNSMSIVKEAKYKIGTKFIRPTDKNYGRIVGYDGKFYQVYYKDTSCDALTEDAISRMKFIHHKRPRKMKKMTNDCMEPRCPQCSKLYSADSTQVKSGRTPIQSQNCSHLICFDCLQAIRIRDSTVKQKNLRNTVDCPFCHKAKAFNAVDPTVCIPMCQMAAMYYQMKYKEQLFTNGNKGRKRETPQLTFDRKRSKSCVDDRKDSNKDKMHINIKEESIKCPYCKICKEKDKFSSRQLERKESGKKKFQCRRCEDKDRIQQKFGPGFDKFSTTVYIKKGGSTPKFLTTILPFSDGINGRPLKRDIRLPSNLLIDGYTREDYGRFANGDAEQEKLWMKSFLWSNNSEKLNEILKFLKSQEKSAYGTFILPDNTDGFFVIPFDQPDSMSKGVFCCKYVLGLGVFSDESEGCEQQPKVNETETSTLRSLLIAESKLSHSLEMVPQGSVTAAKKVSFPSSPAVSRGPSDWFRQKIVIEEISDDDSENSEKDEKPDMTQSAAFDV